MPSLPHTVSVPVTWAPGAYCGNAAKSCAGAEIATRSVASESTAVSFILFLPLRGRGLFELLQLFARDFRRERKIAAILQNVLLSLAAEDVGQEGFELGL